MATTFRRTCIKDLHHPEEGQLLKQGETYLTSPVDDGSGSVLVYTRFWFEVPLREFFDGSTAILFSGDALPEYII